MWPTQVQFQCICGRSVDVQHQIVLPSYSSCIYREKHFIMAIIGRSNSRSTFGRTNNGCKTFATYGIPCIICTLALSIIIYEIAWMYYLPGLLMMNDTEELTITQYESGDGSKVIQTKKTVTRRRPDLLFKHDNGQKVPKYVVDFWVLYFAFCWI